jgi:hypothetical protein
MPLVSAPNLTQTAGGQNLYAVAGAIGPGGGVEQLLAGANITLSPPDGLGVVTITAAGGGGPSGVQSVTATGSGLTANTTAGAVVLENTGVTSLTTPPGSGITLAGSTGSVTVTNSGVLSLAAGPGIAVSGGVGDVTISSTGLPVFPNFQSLSWNLSTVGQAPLQVTSNLFKIQLTSTGGDPFYVDFGDGGYALFNGGPLIQNPAWNAQTVVFGVLGQFPSSVIPQFPIGIYSPCNGSVSIGVNGTGNYTGPTVRRINIFGSGKLPSQNVSIGGDNNVIYCLVVQGVV